MSQSTAYCMCAKKDSNLPVHFHVLTEPSLKSVSSQCARDKSSIARKPEVQSKLFKWLITFQKCYPPDFNFQSSQLTDKIFTVWSNVNYAPNLEEVYRA